MVDTVPGFRHRRKESIRMVERATLEAEHKLRLVAHEETEHVTRSGVVCAVHKAGALRGFRHFAVAPPEERETLRVQCSDRLPEVAKRCRGAQVKVVVERGVLKC